MISSRTSLSEKNKDQSHYALHTRIKRPYLCGQERYDYPDPPLNFTVNLYGAADEFDAELDGIVQATEAKSLQRLVAENANQRNRILYAHKTGIAKVELKDDGFNNQLEQCMVILAVTLLIAQRPEKQSFVEHAPSEFVKLLAKMRKSNTARSDFGA